MPTMETHGSDRQGTYQGRAMVKLGGFRQSARETTNAVMTRHMNNFMPPGHVLHPQLQQHSCALKGNSGGELIDEDVGRLVQAGRLTSTVKAHNDWRVHTPDGPPPPPGFVPSEFLKDVGGAVVGYTGHIPGKPQEFGRASIGGTAGHQLKPFAQRGHGQVAKMGSGWRVPADASKSQRAASSAVGYAGHVPELNHSMGISYWRGAARGATDIHSVADGWEYEA